MLYRVVQLSYMTTNPPTSITRESEWMTRCAGTKRTSVNDGQGQGVQQRPSVCPWRTYVVTVRWMSHSDFFSSPHIDAKTDDSGQQPSRHPRGCSYAILVPIPLYPYEPSYIHPSNHIHPSSTWYINRGVVSSLCGWLVGCCATQCSGIRCGGGPCLSVKSGLSVSQS